MVESYGRYTFNILRMFDTLGLLVLYTFAIGYLLSFVRPHYFWLNVGHFLLKTLSKMLHEFILYQELNVTSGRQIF